MVVACVVPTLPTSKICFPFTNNLYAGREDKLSKIIGGTKKRDGGRKSNEGYRQINDRSQSMKNIIKYVIVDILRNKILL